MLLKHKLAATGSNNPDKQVSHDAWNDNHDLTGTPGMGIMFDGGGIAAEADVVGLAVGTIGTMVLALFASAASASVPLGTDVIQTSGYSAKGVGGGQYIYDAAVDAAYVTANPRTSFRTVNARGFRLLYDQPVAPETFGCAGDGVTDDYAAWQAMAAWANARTVVELRFGRGKTYFLNQKIISGNGIVDATFTGLKSLVIDGNGSTIKLPGGWDRNVSTTRNITPFLIQDSQNITIAHLTIDGGIATITNSSAALVPPSYGIRTASCLGVYFNNVHTNSCLADGMTFRDSATTVGGARLANRNVTLVNCTSKFNARCGVSLIQARSVSVIGGDYGFSGFIDEVGTATPFTNAGGPACSFDVEPDNTPTQGNVSDVKTGDISLINVKMRGNAGPVFNAWKFAGGEYYNENVHLTDCLIEANDGVGGGTDMFTLCCPGATMRGCIVDSRDRICYAGWNINAAAAPDMEISGNLFKGRSASSAGFFNSRAMLGGRIQFNNNKFVGYHSAPVSGPWILQFANPYCSLKGNGIFIPKEAYVDLTATDLLRGVQMMGRISSNNSFETDLLAASGSSGTAHVATMYDPATVVSNDRFRGTAPGLSDTFRPGNNTTSTVFAYDTNNAYNSSLATSGALAAAGVVTGSNLNASGLPTSLAALSIVGNATNGLAAGTAIAAASDGQVMRRSGTALGFGALDLASANAVTGDLPFANITQLAGLSIAGRSANTTGDIAAITGVDGQVLRVSGTALGFGTIATAGIAANAVTDAILRQGGALTVVGRSANSSGNVADITAANNQVLRVSGSVLGFGAVDVSTAQITGRLPYANLAQGSALSVLGVTGNGAADVASMIGTADQVLRVNSAGTALAFGTIATAGIADNSVTYAKAQDVSAASRLIGRGSAAGAGDPQELTLSNILMSGTVLTGIDSSHANFNVHVAGFFIDTCPISNSSTAVGVADRFQLHPWIPCRDTTIDQIGVECTTLLNPSNAKVAVYDADATTGGPNNLLFETANLDCSTTGYKSAAQAYTFKKGNTYWFGVRTSSTQTLRAYAQAGTRNIGKAAGTGGSGNAYQVTLTYATAATNPFGALSSGNLAGVSPYAVMMRLA